MKKVYKLLTMMVTLSIAVSPLNVFALTKTETVYTTLNGYGEVSKSTVSNHLSFIGDQEIQDETYLKEILNINGDENFTLKEDKLAWENKGKDIFYQGEYKENYPIKTNITYYLDGKSIKLEELNGKSGKVKIKIKFTNTLKNKVKVNGKYKTLYTPFVTTVGTVLDSNAKNIKINNGKVISTGSRSMVVGIASPGLYDSLGISEFRDLDGLTIEYETTKFDIGSMYIVSTPKLLEEKDFDIFDKMDELYLSINELQVNMNKLESGAKELEKGAKKLEKGSNELDKGLDATAAGIESIKSGAKALNQGVKTILTSLNGDKTKEEMQKEMDNKIKSLNALKKSNTNTINSLLTQINTNGFNLTVKDVNEIYTDVVINGNTANPYATMLQNQTLSQAVGLIYLLSQNNAVIDQTVESFKSIATLTDALEAVSKGANELDNGIDSLKIGIKKLQSGSKEFNAGMNSLNKGITTLSKGTKEFNEKGICKLVDYAEKLKDVSDKAEALIKLSENYKGYASNNADETVFIATVK